MAATLVAYRLRVRDQSTIANPNGTVDALIASSVAGYHPYLVEAPSGDGSQLDPLQGTVTVGAYRIKVIDAAAAGGGVIPGAGVNPAGVVTSLLNAATDTPLLNSYLSRRAYIEISNDGGVTWPTVWIAGYVNRVQLLDAATYEFTIGESLRLETATTVFKTLIPGFDQGTCVLGGPIAGTPQPTPVQGGGAGHSRQRAAAATLTPGVPAWNNSTSYTPGKLVIIPATQVVYLCILGNTNDMPPDAAHWTPMPPGFSPAGVWNPTTTYSAGQVVVDLGAAYLYINNTPSSNHEPPNSTYWEPLLAIMLPNWSIIQDYGGVTCVVGEVGATTQSFSMTLTAGWFKVPVKNPGAPAWNYRTGTSIPADFSSANALIPQLCAQFGPSPRGYGGTFANPGGGGYVPGSAYSAPQGGVVDTNGLLGDDGNLGWIIGGIILQVTLPGGQTVSVNAYPQLVNQGTAKGARYTQTPVLVHPISRTIWVDWHDAYRLSSTGQPVDPVDQNGIPVPYSAVSTGDPALSVKAVVLPIATNTPLHLAMHPVDLLCQLWANAGIAWNPVNVGVTFPVGLWNNTAIYTQYEVVATSGSGYVRYYMATQATTPANTAVTNGSFWQQVTAPMLPTAGGMRNLLGPDLCLVVQVTAPMTIADVFQQWIGGPLGIGRRINSVGANELVLTRTVPNAAPSVTWTDSDCIEGDTSVVWDLDEQRVCQQAVYNWTSFVDWDSNINATRPLDDVLPVPNSSAMVDDDFAAFGTQSVSFTIPGGYAGLTMQSGPTMLQMASALAQQIFERSGRASVWATVSILGTSAQANLGDVVSFNSIRTPNPATNERGGARYMMVIKKTVYPYGAQYVLEDLGAAGAPAATVPAITLSLDAVDPYHVVDVTVTNIATLLSDYPDGSVQIQYTVLLPVDAGTPPAGIVGIIASDQFTASTNAATCALPPVAIGSVVSVRAQSRPGAGQLASAWSAWSTITLTTAAAPINTLGWSDLGDGAGLLTWVNGGDITTPVQVWMTDGFSNVLVPIEQLPPLSVQLPIVGLQASKQYTVAVAHLEPAPSTGFTQPAQLTFTTGTSAGTCAAPSDPIPYVLVWPAQSVVGYCVYNNELVPGTALVVEQATETGVNSGSYGAFAEVVREIVPPAAWFVFKQTLPHDNLRRQIRAYALRAGVSDSADSPVVTVSTSVALSPQDYPVTVPACVLEEVNFQSGVAINVTYTPPTDVQFLQMNYGIEVRPAGTTGAFTALQAVPGTNTGSDFIPAVPGNQYRITPSTLTTGSPALLTQDGIAVQPTQTFGVGILITCPLHAADPTIGTPAPGSTQITYPITYDAYTAYIEVYCQEYASSPGTPGPPVESLANYAGTLDTTKTVVSLPPAANLSSGLPYLTTTFVAYDQFGNRGISTTLTTQRSSGAATSAPTLTTVQAFPMWVIIKATFVTTPSVGDMLYLYRGGVEVNSYTVVSGDISNGYAEIADYTATYPNTYSYTATQLTGGSLSAASGADSVTMSAGGTLATPANSTFTKRFTVRGSGMFTVYTGYITIIPHAGSGDPPVASGVLYVLQYSTNGGSSWTTVPGGGTQDGVGVEVEVATAFVSGGGPSVQMRTFAVLSGWTDSADSSTVTASPGTPW